MNIHYPVCPLSNWVFNEEEPVFPLTEKIQLVLSENNIGIEKTLCVNYHPKSYKCKKRKRLKVEEIKR